MKKNILLLSLALAGVVSANSFAYEIHKGKLLEHKEWTTGTAKGSFIANPSNKMSSKLTSSTGSFEIFSSASPAKSLSGSPAKILGDTSIYIANYTEQAQVYHYTISVCGMMADNLESCLFSFDSVSLEPSGYFLSNVTPELQLTFDKPGSYKTYVSTYVTVDGFTSNGSSISSSTAEVS